MRASQAEVRGYWAERLTGEPPHPNVWLVPANIAVCNRNSIRRARGGLSYGQRIAIFFRSIPATPEAT